MHKCHLTHIVCYLLSRPLLDWHMSAWTREGLPIEGTPKLKSAKVFRKSNQVNKESNECVPLIRGVHVYLSIINYVWPRHGLGPCLGRRWAWALAQALSSIIVDC